MDRVPVKWLATDSQIRRLARCHGFLLHRADNDAEEHANELVAELGEWFQLASFLIGRPDPAGSTEGRRRKLYGDIRACVRKLETSGFYVLAALWRDRSRPSPTGRSLFLRSHSGEPIRVRVSGGISLSIDAARRRRRIGRGAHPPRSKWRNGLSQEITQVTRRAIFDDLTASSISWSGRLEETEFLVRLYDLANMRSTGGRFSNAAGDIFQHGIVTFDFRGQAEVVYE